MSLPEERALSLLLVEDSPMDGRLLIEALKPAVLAGEVVIQTVKFLSHAIDALHRYDFSCVLLDLGLPDGKGVDNVRALREVDHKTAIIVLTGLADEAMAAEALKQGAQDYLIKGESDADQLLKQVRRAIQRNRLNFDLETRRNQAFFEASRDPLTLLPNAALFAERAHQQLGAARRDSRSGRPPFAIACLHIRGLQALRDSHQQLLVDDLLKTLCERWSDILRPGDTLARIGEDDFALLRQPACHAREWALAVEELRLQMDSVVAPEQPAAPLLLGGAVVRADEQPGGLDAMLLAARELAVQAADALARGGADLPRVPVSSTDTVAVLSAPGCWQPWVDCGSGRCLGLELLLPEDRLIRSAEQSASRTLAAAAQLVEQARAWRLARFLPPQVALDIPAAALEHEGFVSALIAQLGASELHPRSLQLEIGEAAFKPESPLSVAVARLRKHGYRLVLDGDGSQDISLHTFAVSAIDGYKLSPALIATLVDESLQGGARRFISAILGAAQQLGSTVIATGVDSQAAVAALQLIGVRYLQGRALLPPLDAESVPVAFERPVTLRS